MDQHENRGSLAMQIVLCCRRCCFEFSKADSRPCVCIQLDLYNRAISAAVFIQIIQWSKFDLRLLAIAGICNITIFIYLRIIFFAGQSSICSAVLLQFYLPGLCNPYTPFLLLCFSLESLSNFHTYCRYEATRRM